MENVCPVDERFSAKYHAEKEFLLRALPLHLKAIFVPEISVGANAQGAIEVWQAPNGAYAQFYLEPVVEEGYDKQLFDEIHHWEELAWQLLVMRDYAGSYDEPPSSELEECGGPMFIDEGLLEHVLTYVLKELLLQMEGDCGDA